MNRLNRGQKDKVRQFQTVTGAAEPLAIECLKAGQWLVEAAIDVFYSSGASAAPPQPAVNRAAIEVLYAKYADDHHDAIMAEGVGQLCEDLGVDPSDVVMLVLSWHFGAATMCEFSREEFVNGMAGLGCESLAALTAKLPALRAELRDARTFKDVYVYAYGFSCEKGQKCVQLDVALAMWQLLLGGRWPLLDAWCAFLQAEHKRAISRDTWVQLLEFANVVGDDLSSYDENGAWPYLLDEFVEWQRQQDGMQA